MTDYACKAKVYRDILALVKQIKSSTHKLTYEEYNKFIKETEIDLIDILALIYNTYESYDNPANQLNLINKAITDLRKVLIYFRIFNDLGFIKTSGYSAISDDLIKCIHQLINWSKSLDKSKVKTD